MTDNDYIRKGVELADGFQVSLTAGGNALETYYYPSGMGHTVRTGHAPQSWLDALAAQLVRQVYTHQVRPQQFVTYVNYALDPIDTIRDIVDSKILEAP